MKISVGARSSPLSRAQVTEVLTELRQYYPEIAFETTLVTTTGDHDQKTSLRTLDKTDFFTKEIDHLLLNRECRIGVHSAKDLPDPIPDGLSIIAVTEGVDSSDSLVLPPGCTLKPGDTIATSSERREESVRQLCSDLNFVDIRGTIGQRLEKLNDGKIQGVVIAEAALIRLGWTHLNRITLPGTTTPGQGQLAVLARKNDQEIQDFFECIDSRKKCLYLGLDIPQNTLTTRYVHCPIIKIVPRKIETYPEIASFTHVIFTSKTSVKIFFDHFKELNDKIILSVGKKTTQKLLSLGIPVSFTAEDECSEGIVSMLEQMDLTNAKILWPHSVLSRGVIKDFLGDKCTDWILYDTVFNEPYSHLNLNDFDEIMFTSPSTVDAFAHFFKEPPKDIILTPIGRVTCAYLSNQTEWNKNKEFNHAVEV